MKLLRHIDIQAYTQKMVLHDGVLSKSMSRNNSHQTHNSITEEEVHNCTLTINGVYIRMEKQTTSKYNMTLQIILVPVVIRRRLQTEQFSVSPNL